MLLKLTINYGKDVQGDSHPIISDWVWAWAVPSKIRMVPEQKHV
jgi:hypothetical protein